MKMLKKLNNKKGFTLVEIVIVIVIIAILAAMLVPSLLRWVDNANQKSFLEAANTIKTSTLSEITDAYASNRNFSWANVTTLVGKDVSATANTGDYWVSGLTGISETSVPTTNTIDTFVVENAKYKATWNEDEGNWTVVKQGASNAG